MGVLAVAPSCASCGLNLKEGDTGDAGAVLIVIVLGAIVGGLALWTEFRFEPPLWAHLVIWPIVTVPLAIGAMRLAKSALIGMQYRHRSSEMGL
jgi:uncharacterized protein (DUF983 family)